MNDYKVLITSTLGLAGTVVTLADCTQTKERLKKGIICEIKVVAPVETKRKAKK